MDYDDCLRIQSNDVRLSALIEDFDAEFTPVYRKREF